MKTHLGDYLELLAYTTGGSVVSEAPGPHTIGSGYTITPLTHFTPWQSVHIVTSLGSGGRTYLRTVPVR
jgi:hypothetical protein